MLNQVALLGRLTADPELRYTLSGHTVSNFILSENVAKYMEKGSPVALYGRLQVDWGYIESLSKYFIGFAVIYFMSLAVL